MKRAGSAPRSYPLILAASAALATVLLPPSREFATLNGVLTLVAAGAFFLSMRGFTREISVSRRLGLLLVLSGVTWGAVTLVSGSAMGRPGAEGERFRLLRTMNREALAEASLENAEAVRDMVSLDLPGPGGAVVNALSDATGATLGAIAGTVLGASALNEGHHAPLSGGDPTAPERLCSLGIVGALGALLTMMALIEGLVMTDRTGATHFLYWTAVGAVFVHTGLTALGAGDMAVARVMQSPVSVSFLLVLCASVVLGCCQRWIHYLNRRGRLMSMTGALVFAELCRRVTYTWISEGIPDYNLLTMITMVGTASMLFAVYGYGSLLTIVLHMPSARLLDRRYRELNTLQDLSHSLHSSFEPGQLATAATRLGRRLTGADCCWIVPGGPETGFPGVWCGDGYDYTGEIPGEWYGFLTSRLDSARRGLLFNNYRRTALEKLFPGKGRIGSLLVSQVEIRGEHLGLLLASCGKSFRFVNHNRGLFDSFARQIAQAFHNARLFGEKLELERLQRELDLAREIQRQLFPRVIHQPEGYEISAMNIPSRVVGGDYYDVIPLEGRRVALAVADVAGKGAAASILMAGLQSGIRSLFLSTSSLPELVPLLNRLVCSQVPEGTFITLFLGVLNCPDGTMEYCNAGHDPPILADSRGGTERLESGGLVLGLYPDAAYETGRAVILPGSRLLMYTDGVTDAFSARDEEPFGVRRLMNTFLNHADDSARDVLKKLIRLIDGWVGDEPHTDDLTLMAVFRLDENRAGKHNKNHS